MFLIKTQFGCWRRHQNQINHGGSKNPSIEETKSPNHSSESTDRATSNRFEEAFNQAREIQPTSDSGNSEIQNNNQNSSYYRTQPVDSSAPSTSSNKEPCEVTLPRRSERPRTKVVRFDS